MAVSLEIRKVKTERQGESFFRNEEIVSFRSFDPLSVWIEMIRDAS